MCLGVLAGVPCTSFSRAVRNPIRSSEFPEGVPELNSANRSKVSHGNLILQGALSFFSICRRHGVPFIWENPRTSFMWLCPRVRATERWAGVEDVFLDQCQYGSKWKKSTTLRCFNVADPQRLHRRCQRPRGSPLCSATGRPHFVLEGRDPHGVHWTSRAAAYPTELSKSLADIMQDTALQNVFAWNAAFQPMRGEVQKQRQRRYL